MSHSVKVSIALNIERELNFLDNIKNEVNECSQIYKDYFSNEIEKIINKIKINKDFIKNLGENIVDTDDKNEIFNYQKRISSIIKEVSNLKSAINYSQVYSDIEYKNNASINNLITEYGIMAIFAIEELNNENSEINAVNIKRMIEKNREKKLDDEKTQAIKLEVQKIIIKSNIPSKIKKEFINFFQQAKTYQEYMDLFAFLKTKIFEFQNMLGIVDDIIKSLKYVGFKYKSQDYLVNEEGIITTKIIAYKDGTKDLKVKVNSDKKMEWQFGDYENHMCDADGEKFRKIALPKFGIKTTNWQITRNISRSKPLREMWMAKEK